MRDLIDHYILNEDGTTKRVDLMTWAHWFENFDNRFIALYERDGYRVSTVFLGIDHRFGGGGPPLLFETMMFDDQREVRDIGNRLYRMIGEELSCERYSTKDDAVIGHERCVKRLNEMFDAANITPKVKK